LGEGDSIFQECILFPTLGYYLPNYTASKPRLLLLLIAWSRIVFEKVIVPQLVENFNAF
jgi:hypothetical protein